MSEKTNIELATHTASPWFGCSRVSAGCVNCYAEALTLQRGWAGWGDSSPRVRSKGFWKDAYRYNRAAAKAEKENLDTCLNMEFYQPLVRPRMFTSLMDWLDPKAPIEWLADFLRVIHDCQNLDWLLLTKRPELFLDRTRAAIACARGLSKPGPDEVEAFYNPDNVWMGVTVENQEMADKRIPELLKIPARIKWLSIEPLLGPIDLQRAGAIYENADGDLEDPNPTLRREWKEGAISWAVVGGESGPKRRDCGVQAIVDIAEQCRVSNVPIFVKQDVGLRPGLQGRIPDKIWALKEYPHLSIEDMRRHK